MIHLDFNETKEITFYLQPSLVTPIYLLSLINFTTRERLNFLAVDSSTTSNLLQFSVTEVGSGVADLMDAKISIDPFGTYTIQVYEQVSATNLDETLATFLGDDTIIFHKEPVFDFPPKRNPIGIPPVSCTLSVTVSGNDPTFLGASDGDATANDIGGQGNITYLWDDAGAQTTKTATGLPEGTYTVIVTDDIMVGCTATDNTTLEAGPGLPALGSLLVNLDGTDAGQINGGGASVDDPVASWDDLTPNNNDATQATAGFRPIFKGDHIEFEGTASRLTLGTVMSKPSEYTMIAVFKSDVTSGDHLIGEHNSTNGTLGITAFINTIMRSGYSDGTNFRLTNSSDNLTTNKMIYSDRFDVANGPLTSMQFDGVDQTEVDAGGSATSIGGTKTDLMIGCKGIIFTQFFTGKFFHLALWNTRLSDADLLTATNVLNAQHNVF